MIPTPYLGKGGNLTQSQRVFHFGSNLQKKVPNYSPGHYPHKKKMLRAVIWHLCLEIGETKWKTLWDKATFIMLLISSISPYISIDFQEKIGEDKNKNSSHDFKTLADVLIQESIRYDMGKEFPELKDSIQAKL